MELNWIHPGCLVAWSSHLAGPHRSEVKRCIAGYQVESIGLTTADKQCKSALIREGRSALIHEGRSASVGRLQILSTPFQRFHEESFSFQMIIQNAFIQNSFQQLLNVIEWFHILPYFLPSFLPSFIRSFIHLFCHSFIHSFSHSFIPASFILLSTIPRGTNTEGDARINIGLIQKANTNQYQAT